MAAEAPSIGEIPVARNRKELRGNLEKLDVNKEVIDRLMKKRKTVEKRHDLLEGIRAAHPEWNGQAEVVSNKLVANLEQIDANRKFVTGKDELTDETDGDESDEKDEKVDDFSDEALATSDTPEAKEAASKNPMLKAAQFLYQKTFVEHKGLLIGTLAVIGLVYFVPTIVSSLAGVPKYIEGLMRLVPMGKMRAMLESMLKLSPTTQTIPPGMGMGGLNSVGRG